MLMKSMDDKSADIASLETLLARPDLTRQQSGDIRNQLYNVRTGLSGEKTAAHFLDVLFDESDRTALIHDLRLQVGAHFTQIDHLLLNRFGRAYVLETKNLKADLECSETGLWTAWYDNKPVRIASPVEQARSQVALLSRWLKANAITVKRIEPVILVAPTCRVISNRNKRDEDVPIVQSDMFRRWYENDRNVGSLPGMIWSIATGWTVEDLRKYGQILVDAHTPLQPNRAAQFGIDIEDKHNDPSTWPPVPPSRKVPAHPNNVVTRRGMVAVVPTAYGFALRHDADLELAAWITQCVSGFGRWNGKYRNWLVNAEDLQAVVDRMRAS